MNNLLIWVLLIIFIWAIPVALTYILLGLKAQGILDAIDEELERWEGKRYYH